MLAKEAQLPKAQQVLASMGVIAPPAFQPLQQQHVPPPLPMQQQQLLLTNAQPLQQSLQHQHSTGLAGSALGGTPAPPQPLQPHGMATPSLPRTGQAAPGGGALEAAKARGACTRSCSDVHASMYMFVFLTFVFTCSC